MTKLSDTALSLLSKAAERDDRLAVAPPKLPAAARNAVANSLKKQGLLEEARPVSAALAWSYDDGGTHGGLRITDAGFRVLGLEPPAAEETFPPETDSNLQESPAVPSIEQGAQPATAVHGPENGPVALPRPTLRQAAQAVVEAWGGSCPADDTPLVSAIARLAAALTTGAKQRRDPAPRPPRADTKQAQVLALLGRTEGANIAQIIDTTGWAPHTVRGFLAGLRAKATKS